MPYLRKWSKIEILVATRLLKNWMLIIKQFYVIYESLGTRIKLDIWILHNLTERNLMRRVSICVSLLKRNNFEPFLKHLITGEEKWMTYSKNVRNKIMVKA